jgi:2-amino-4-hydroxy-6-hydroxymethyldihydropteridine diphosphokinase
MSSAVARAFIGLGSNLDDPVAQVERALEALAALRDTRFVACSGLYQSEPMGPRDQPDYINAVAALDTRLGPHALLHALQAIETRQGRVRSGARWGPRTLDLDLLLYGMQHCHDAQLTVPHPGIQERPFVLYPLYEIAPDIDVPGLASLPELLAACAPRTVSRLDRAGKIGLQR